MQKSSNALFGANRVNSQRKVKVKLQFANQFELANHIQLLLIFIHTRTHTSTKALIFHDRIRTHKENTQLHTHENANI